MPAIFSFEETPDSRAFAAEPGSYTLKYKADGEHDDSLVQAYAIAATPSSVFTPIGQLFRQNVQVDPDGWSQYVVTVPYGKRQNAIGSLDFSFDTTGGTARVRCAKEHIASFPDDGTWNDGAIGRKPDGDVEGVDIIIPAMKLSYTFKHPTGVVDEAYARSLHNITGMTNSATFRGFAAGELLFFGATGSDGTNAEASVTYQLLASPNVTDLTFGSISSVVKQGWHVASVEFEEDVDTGEPVTKPKRVSVDRVYDAVSFADYFGWS